MERSVARITNTGLSSKFCDPDVEGNPIIMDKEMKTVCEKEISKRE